MTTINDMLERIRSIDLQDMVVDTMIESSNEIVQINRDQMLDGLNSEGDAITPAYKNITREIKSQKGQPFNRVTLKDTGEFQSRMFLLIKGSDFDINSTDWKTPGLVNKYSRNGDIFGLTDESKRVAWTELIKPTLLRQIKEQTGMK